MSDHLHQQNPKPDGQDVSVPNLIAKSDLNLNGPGANTNISLGSSPESIVGINGNGPPQLKHLQSSDGSKTTANSSSFDNVNDGRTTATSNSILLSKNNSKNRSNNDSDKYDSEGLEQENDNDEKKYYCSTCNKGFSRKHNMVSHELIHSQVKPHVCSVCSSTFRRIHDLKRHEKLHTGEKPFKCQYCPKSFARPDSLTRHQNSQSACPGLVRSLKLENSSGNTEMNSDNSSRKAPSNFNSDRPELPPLSSITSNYPYDLRPRASQSSGSYGHLSSLLGSAYPPNYSYTPNQHTESSTKEDGRGNYVTITTVTTKHSDKNEFQNREQKVARSPEDNRRQQLGSQALRDLQARDQYIRDLQARDQNIRDEQMRAQRKRDQEIRDQEYRDQRLRDQKIREQQYLDQEERKQGGFDRERERHIEAQHRELQRQENQRQDFQRREQWKKEQQNRGSNSLTERRMNNLRDVQQSIDPNFRGTWLNESKSTDSEDSRYKSKTLPLKYETSAAGTHSLSDTGSRGKDLSEEISPYARDQVNNRDIYPEFNSNMNGYAGGSNNIAIQNKPPSSQNQSSEGNNKTYYNQSRDPKLYQYPNEEYISLSRYQDLVAYTQSLEENMNFINSRIRLLEDESADNKIEREREKQARGSRHAKRHTKSQGSERSSKKSKREKS